MVANTPGHLRVLVFGASLRTGSFNNRLAALAAGIASARGVDVDRASFREFDVGSFNADVQASDGIPPGSHELRTRLEAADGFIISSPEYNASMPGVLKNLIDWTSRHSPQPFKGSHGLLMSASPSMTGGNRGLWALRQPLEHLGAIVHPDMFSLAQAHQAFASDGNIADVALRERFEANIEAFLNLTEAATHYACAKTAWVEFLGERTDPATERVEIS